LTLGKALQNGFVLTGQYSNIVSAGQEVAGNRLCFSVVVCSQNHDQVGNRRSANDPVRF
jgi:hypothetical protein